MKHVARYFKMLLNQEYREKEEIKIGEAICFLVISILCLFFILTEIGRDIAFVLAMFCCVILSIACFAVPASEIIKIVKKFQFEKEKWDIEEEFEEKSNNREEKKSMYFLDFSAFEHYSKNFYANFLTDSFSYDCITKEPNAVLVTDRNTWEHLKNVEGSWENKDIFNGYTTFIKSKFKLIDILENETLAMAILKLQEEGTVTVLTKDENLLHELERDAIKVKLIEEE